MKVAITMITNGKTVLVVRKASLSELKALRALHGSNNVAIVLDVTNPVSNVA